MNKFTVGTLIAAALALIGVGAGAVYENHQTNKKVGKSMEELKNASVREISEGLLKEAVTKAADMAVDKYVRNDNESILSKANSRLTSEIDSLVRGRYDEVTNDVSERLAKHVAQLDNPDKLKKAVRERAEDILVKRFDNDLDDLKRRAEDAFDDANERYENKLDDAIDRFEEKLDDKVEGYVDSLSSMKKVYDTLEKALSGHRGDRDGKEIRFTLG